MYNIKWKERKRKMKTWNKGKRTLALLVCVLLTVLSVVPAMGAPRTQKTLEITNTSFGHTYKVYQLLKGQVSGLDNGKGTLSNMEKGDNLLADKTVKDVTDAINGKTDGDLGDAAYALINTSSTPAATITIDQDATSGSAKVEEGYYVIVDSYSGAASTEGKDTVSRYMVAVVGDTTMEAKTVTPDIDKKIVDTDANQAIDGVIKKTDTAAIGDVIEYEVTGTVPNMEGYKYYYYYLTDTLSKGLTLDESSFKVTIGNTEITKYVSGDAANTNYYLKTISNSDGTNSFILSFEDLKSLVSDGTIKVGDTITIKYNAMVNDSALIGSNPNTNTVHLNYSNNPQNSTRHDSDDTPGTPKNDNVTGHGPDKVTKTYVMELVILKVDETGKKLSGAQFTLVGENLTKVIVDTTSSFEAAGTGETGEYYKLKNDTYTKIAPTDATLSNYEDGTNVGDNPKYVRKTTTSVSTAATGEGSSKSIYAEVNAEGYLVFTGLNAGTYTLKETKTPEGYNTMKDMTFTIGASQENATANEGGSIKWSVSGVDASSFIPGTNNIFTKITNLKGNVLPSTGGIGTHIFYIVGGILMVSAGVVLVTKARFKKNK